MQEFLIAPTAGRAVWLVLLVPGLIVLLVTGVLGAAVAGARSASFEVSPAGLRLRGDLYGRVIPLEELKTELATRVDLSAESQLTPARRTLGTGLPGYRAGWFRLRNGEKALVYLTDTSRAVYVPTTAGYGVLVSPANPDAFVAALRGIGRSDSVSAKAGDT